MSTPVSDYPDWLRTVVFIPPPVHVPPPPVTLGGGSSLIGPGWTLALSGALKIVRFTISNPHHTDGTNTGASAAAQDSIWVQYIDHGSPAPTDGDVSGIYLPSPGFLFEDAWFGDVYWTKAGEIAADPVCSLQVVLSTYP